MLGGVGAIVLAAGGSTRFGALKQLYEYRGESLVRRAARLVGEVVDGPVVVVVGCEHERVESALGDLKRPVEIRHNPEWRSGQASSLAAGVARLVDSNVAAALVHLVDQPALEGSDLESLRDRWREGGADLVAARFEGGAGPPAIFSRSLFHRLLDLRGDVGARSLFGDSELRRAFVELPAAGADWDQQPNPPPGRFPDGMGRCGKR